MDRFFDVKTSDEALKFLKLSVDELYQYRGNPIHSANEAIRIDPDLIKAYIVLGICEGLGSLQFDRPPEHAMMKLLHQIDQASLRHAPSAAEHLHIEALKAWLRADITAAAGHWEEVIRLNPFDLLAIRILHDCYFFLGASNSICESVANILQHWQAVYPELNQLNADSSSPPTTALSLPPSLLSYFGYLLGQYSFGLEETAQYKKSSLTAQRALALNPNDAWTMHALAHVHEMQAWSEAGADLMGRTEYLWKDANLMAGHLYWHWAVYAWETGNWSEVWRLYDGELKGRCETGAMLDLVDAASLLWRLELEGLDHLNEDLLPRFQSLCDKWNPHLHSFNMAFNDTHIVMCFLGAKRLESDACQAYLREMEQYVQRPAASVHGQNHDIMNQVGFPLVKALIAWHQARYGDVVDLIQPIRQEIISLGGSHAQRDIFEIFLEVAALKAARQDVKYVVVAREYFENRQRARPHSARVQRLAVQFADILF